MGWPEPSDHALGDHRTVTSLTALLPSLTPLLPSLAIGQQTVAEANHPGTLRFQERHGLLDAVKPVAQDPEPFISVTLRLQGLSREAGVIPAPSREVHVRIQLLLDGQGRRMRGISLRSRLLELVPQLGLLRRAAADRPQQQRPCRQDGPEGPDVPP